MVVSKYWPIMFAFAFVLVFVLLYTEVLRIIKLILNLAWRKLLKSFSLYNSGIYRYVFLNWEKICFRCPLIYFSEIWDIDSRSSSWIDGWRNCVMSFISLRKCHRHQNNNFVLIELKFLVFSPIVSHPGSTDKNKV